MSAAFVLNYLRRTFLFRGSLSSPNPDPRSTRLSTVSPTSKPSIFLFFLRKKRKKKKGQSLDEAKRKSDCFMHGWATRGEGLPPAEAGRVEHPWASGSGGARQLTCREAALRTGIFSGIREGEGREQTKALLAVAARSEGSREPPAPFLPLLLHTSLFPPLLSREIQPRQEATSVHVFISHSGGIRQHMSLLGFFAFSFFFWNDSP